MTLSPIKIEPGKTVSFAAVYCGGGRVDATPMTTSRRGESSGRRRSNLWKTADLPYDRVIVPDKNIQALFDSSIRNIWQAREIKNGLPAFQVGADVLSRIVDRRRRVHSRSGHDPRRRRSGPGGHRLRIHLPAARRPLSKSCRVSSRRTASCSGRGRGTPG